MLGVQGLRLVSKLRVSTKHRVAVQAARVCGVRTDYGTVDRVRPYLRARAVRLFIRCTYAGYTLYGYTLYVRWLYAGYTLYVRWLGGCTLSARGLALGESRDERVHLTTHVHCAHVS